MAWTLAQTIQLTQVGGLLPECWRLIAAGMLAAYCRNVYCKAIAAVITDVIADTIADIVCVANIIANVITK